MTARMLAQLKSDRMTRIVDWSVFLTGAASLAFAMTMTVLNAIAPDDVTATIAPAATETAVELG